MAARKPAPSTRPAWVKTGLKPGMSFAVFDAPADLDLGTPPAGTRKARTSLDWALHFVRDVAHLERAWKPLRAAVKAGASVWVAYPKKSGALATDLTRDVGWDVVFADDWHPVSLVSLDATWSALRLRPRAEIKVMTRRSITPGKR